MKIQSLSSEEVFSHLQSGPAGITIAEARRRLAEHGRNEIQQVERRSMFSRLMAQFLHFLALLLWFAAGLCFLSEYLHPGEGLLRLGIAILGVIFINAIFTFIQEYRAENAVKELRKLLPFRVIVIRSGNEHEVDADQVVPGDLIILREGDKVPADARVVESHRLTVNNASLTGESHSRVLSTPPCDQEPIDSGNLVFAGTLVVGGSGAAVAYATGMATEFGRIAHTTGRIEERRSPLQIEIDHVSRIVAIIALTGGTCFFLMGTLIGRGFWENFLFAIGIIIASVPEGLLPTVTLSLAMGSRRMAKRNALVKNLNAVDALGSVDIICTDKTGTLTRNQMSVKTLWCPGKEREMACRIALLCNNATETMEGLKGDPTETALYRFARDKTAVAGERLDEIPFDTERKRMATLTRIDGRLFILIKGAGESVLPLCTTPDRATAARHEQQYLAMAAEGLRVMTLAYRELEHLPQEGIEENNLTLAGFIGLEDAPRPEVPLALERCRSAGIKVIMITGDAGPTAAAIAREIGLIAGEAAVIDGGDCTRLADEELRDRLRRDNLIFARMSPQNKMRVVNLLIEDGHRVAVTGDGVNDAPALKKAHVGVAMGMTGTSVAREAADIVLLDDNFASIVDAVEEGRAVYENIRSFITYIFASNIPEVIPYICYILLGIPLPLTIMQILAVDLGTDMLPALALGSEKPTPDIMGRPPRPRHERLLSRGVLLRACLFLGVFEALAAMSAYLYVLINGGWSHPQVLAPASELYRQATTACLAGIIATQIANDLSCRSPVHSIATQGFLSNPLVLVGIASELLLAAFIVYTPLGNAIFDCAPLGLNVWLLLVPFALLLLGAEEIRKSLVRRRIFRRAEGSHSGVDIPS
jgi:sodium/potassium-transporting ATPase subunit alpha